MCPSLKYLIVFFSLIFVKPAVAMQVAATADSAPAVEQDVRSDLRVLADRIDDIFGHERADNNKSTSTLRLFASEQMEDGKADNPSFGVRFNLKLATLQRWNKELQTWFNAKMHHIVDELKDKNDAKKGPPKIDRLPPGAPKHIEKDPWRFSIEKKVSAGRWLKTIKAQLGARVSKDIETRNFLHSFSSDLGWSTDNLWQTTATFSSSINLSTKVLFSFANAAGWSISRKNFSTSHGPSIAYAFAENQATSLSFYVSSAIIDKVLAVEGYRTEASYRLEAFNDWIYFSFNPYLEWLRSERFDRNPGFVSRLEIVF